MAKIFSLNRQMLLTIFTVIVFISELIIGYTIISNLIKLDLRILAVNEFWTEANPKIKEISRLTRKISEQIAELVPVYVEKFRELRNKIMLAKLESLIALILFWSINIKVIKKIRKTKVFKLAVRGLSLLSSVV